MSYTFDQFLKDDQWISLKDHYTSFDLKLEKNIDTALINNRINTIREKLIEENRIKKANEVLIKELKKDLVNGDVVAVDGTCANYDLAIAGFQARIGIIAINYQNYRSGYTIYISEPFIPYNKETAEEMMSYAKEKKTGKEGISPSQITSVMLFKERDFVLKRQEKYKMIQGNIFPYELRYGQGKLRGLQSCLKLGRQILNSKNVVAAQTTTNDPRYRYLGLALHEGEYAVLHDYTDELESFLVGDDYSSGAHFNENDKDEFKRFINDVRNTIKIGLYKGLGSKRSYVFYAHKDNLETMVNLLFADSSYQKIRGFPLLLDYADSICSKLLSGSDFTKQVEWKLARKNILEVEMSEKKLRRR